MPTRVKFNGRGLVIAAALAAAGFATNPQSRDVAEGAAPAPQPLAAPAAAEREPLREAEVLEVQTGRASYYASSLAGHRTASGERYDPRALVAAHRDLPFGSVLRVTSLTEDRSVEVRVIDRGPFTRGRVLDVSRRAAEALGMIRAGHIPVRVEVLSYGT